MMSEKSRSNLFSAPLWQSAFRPFYLVGVIYGLGIMILWLADYSPAAYSQSLWHGHEMVFGFSGAIVAGFVLTALPGWAGTAEIDRGPLALLVLLWFLGRAAIYAGAILPPYMVLILDSSLFLVAGIMVLPGLLRVDNKHYLALMIIFLLLFAGNVIFHLAVMDGDMARASWGIRMGLMAIVAKFILAGGFLTTVFTANALQQKKAGRLGHNPLLEYISAASLVLFIYGALGDMDIRLAGSLAFFAAAVQMVRFLRWRTWRIIDAPLVLVMHLSYLWFIFALMLFGAAAFMEQIPAGLWLHAFTVGALSMMMLSLITRVALRHTGRSLVPARLMLLSFGLMFVTAILRVMTSAGILSSDWLAVTIMIWGLSFALYLILHGAYLIRPSLPKRKKTTDRGSDGRASELG